MYLRARYYDSAYGRFTQQDGWEYANFGDPLSLNLYTYCWNNPGNMYDPDGHWSWRNFVDNVKKTTKKIVETAVIVGAVAGAIAVTAALAVGTGGGALVLAGIGLSASTATAIAGVAVAGVVVSAATAAGALVAEGAAVLAGSIAEYCSGGQSSDQWKNGQSYDDIKNKANHIFHNNKHTHNLDDLLNTFDNNEIEAYKNITEIAQDYINKTGISGAEDFIINVNGFDVTVRGKIIDGFFRLNTAFIP